MEFKVGQKVRMVKDECGVINLWSPRENFRKSIDTKVNQVVY